jgi:hypothetical protein
MQCFILSLEASLDAFLDRFWHHILRLYSAAATSLHACMLSLNLSCHAHAHAFAATCTIPSSLISLAHSLASSPKIDQLEVEGGPSAQRSGGPLAVIARWPTDLLRGLGRGVGACRTYDGTYVPSLRRANSTVTMCYVPLIGQIRIDPSWVYCEFNSRPDDVVKKNSRPDEIDYTPTCMQMQLLCVELYTPSSDVFCYYTSRSYVVLCGY